MTSLAVTKTFRLLFVLALLFVMPMLAMPPVLRRIDALLGSDRTVAPLAQEQPTVHSSSAAVQLLRPPQAATPTTERTHAGQPGRPFEASPRFYYIKQRLKTLGTNYMVLEKVPDQDGAFRFHCRMPIPGSRVYSRPFEAVDSSRRQAMERVLAEVETWQAALIRRGPQSGGRIYR